MLFKYDPNYFSFEMGNDIYPSKLVPTVNQITVPYNSKLLT